jgi:hypothetical protein
MMDKLAELIDQFRAEAGYPGGIRPRRDAERAELALALSRDGLDDPDAQLLRRLAGKTYGYPGAQPGYYTLLQTDDGVAKVAATFRYLLYGPGDVADRLDDCIRGEHKLPSVAEAMMVKALAVADPDRWYPNHVTTGKSGKLAVLEVLGQKPPAAPNPGALAVASNDRIRQLLDPHFPGDPGGIGEFTWWLLHHVNVPETPLKPHQIPHAGISRTGDQIRSTIKTLEDSLPEPVILYCLQKAGDPLAAPPGGRWWWAFAEEEETQHGLPPMLEKYQDRKHPPKTKCLVIAGLRRMVDGDGGRQSAPDTDDQAYTSPPRGGEKPKSRVFETDPDKIDRGTTAHKETQDALAEALRKANLKPRSPKPGDPAFDIAWRNDDVKGVAVAFIGEVKSLTDENETWQIRLAIGQVLDYVHMLDSRRKVDSLPPHWKGVHAVRGVVAVERQPTKVDHWTGLCEKLGIILTWPEKYDDTLAGTH